MNLNIAVFFGGRSCEHEISIITALQVMHALKEKYDVIPIYISKEGMFYSGEEYLDIKTYQDVSLYKNNKQKVSIQKEGEHVYCIKNWFKKVCIDIAIPIFHGTNGEDGSIQGFFNVLNVPYVGSSLFSSALAQSKIASKKWMQLHEIPVLAYEVIDANNIHCAFMPCIIKPDRLGSSIGIQVVEDDNMYEQSVMEALLYDEMCIVEPYIETFREINCSVRKVDGEIVCSLFEEVNKAEKILSFHDKYENNYKFDTNHHINPEIAVSLKQEIAMIAKKVYRIFNFDGVIRIDFMIVENKVYVNEINSIPGSYACYLWEEDLLSLLENSMQEAFCKYRKEANKIVHFENDVLFKYHGGKLK